MAELEIGIGKSARRAYALDELSIVPSRRTRDPETVDTTWEMDAYRFDVPVLGAGSDSVTSPATAIEMDRLGGAGVLNIEGLWTRHNDPAALLAELAASDDHDKAIKRLRELYALPIDKDLVTERIRQINASGAVSCAAVTPQRTEELAPLVLEAELDLLVVQGTVVSAEHVAPDEDPLNLKSFIRSFDVPVIVGGCASYQTALHLMRTGAAGILVGVGTASASRTREVAGIGVPQATAIADARAARMRHLDETNVYVHVIADGGISNAGELARAVVCGADAVMLGAPLAASTESPAGGLHWGSAAHHPTLPRGALVRTEQTGTLEEVLLGPALDGEGRTNLIGGLRAAMATCGYDTLKDFQKAELVVTPRERDGAGGV